jgi:hypothetical protein
VAIVCIDGLVQPSIVGVAVVSVVSVVSVVVVVVVEQMLVVPCRPFVFCFFCFFCFFVVSFASFVVAALTTLTARAAAFALDFAVWQDEPSSFLNIEQRGEMTPVRSIVRTALRINDTRVRLQSGDDGLDWGFRFQMLKGMLVAARL